MRVTLNLLCLQPATAPILPSSQGARQGIQGFVNTEKKFLDLAAEEVTNATKGGEDGRKLVRERTKVLTEMARDGVEKYIAYPSNVALYDKWHEYFRKHQPRMLILWGQNDPFFAVAG